MTTIMGFISENGKEGIFASDTQASSIKNKYKAKIDKIKINNKLNFIFAMSGNADNYYDDLVLNLMSDKIDIEKIIETGIFTELMDSNLKRCGNTLLNTDSANSCLFMTNLNNKRKLYKAWPLGKIEEKFFTYIGSGSLGVKNYLESKNTQLYADENINLFGNKNIPRELARKLVYNSLKLANNHDLYSSGLDIIIMNESGIKNIGEKFPKLEDNFDKKTLELILKS